MSEVCPYCGDALDREGGRWYRVAYCEGCDYQSPDTRLTWAAGGLLRFVTALDEWADGVMPPLSVSRLRAAFRVTCDVPGCDEEPDPLFLDDGVVFLCGEHAVEFMARYLDDEGLEQFEEQLEDEGDRVGGEDCPSCGGPLRREPTAPDPTIYRGGDAETVGWVCDGCGAEALQLLDVDGEEMGWVVVGGEGADR